MRTWHNQSMNSPTIHVIAAISQERRALGYQNKLLWHIPEDLKRFKALTTGHVVIMGRKTFDSIIGYLGKPLPNRTSIVISRTPKPDGDEVKYATSLDEAFTKVQELDEQDAFVIGGAEIYSLTLPFADYLHLTLVSDEPEADTFFPQYNNLFEEESEEKSAHNHLNYTFTTLKRKGDKNEKADV